MAPSAIPTKTTTNAPLPLKVTGKTDKEETSLEAISYGPIVLPGIPTHPTFAAHRLWTLNHLTALFRHWARRGFDEGMSGHISLRDPEYPACFWMNPLALHFGLLRASDMLLVADDPGAPAAILAGNRRQRPANRAGWAIHGAVHRARPDVNAACHAHSVAGKAWSATGKRLRMLDQDVCNFYGEALAVYGDYGGVVVGGEASAEAEGIARALGGKGKGCILRNHGLLTVGQTVDEAGFLFGLLERSCEVQLRLAGMETVVIGDREAEFNFRVASTPETLYWEFQPYYDYEEEMSHDNFKDLTEQELELKL